MFRSVILSFVLFCIALTAVHCTVCQPHPKPCINGKNEDLKEDESVFEKWAIKKCPKNDTVIDQADIDLYKNCIKTYIEPCIQEDELLKKLFSTLLEQNEEFDLAHVCKEETRDEIFGVLYRDFMDHKEALEKALGEKCSILKQAMEDIMVCAKIEH